MTRIEKQQKLNAMLNETKYGMIKQLQETIKIRCSITSTILYNWKNGRTEIPDLAMKEIESINTNL